MVVVSRVSGARHDDVQCPWAMHALDPAELDVAGRTWSGDPGLNSHRVEAGDGVGDIRDDLVSMDDANVPVRDEGKGPATLARTMVQHDRAVVAMPRAQVVITAFTWSRVAGVNGEPGSSPTTSAPSGNSSCGKP
jgi:hypothetical protein